MGPGFAASLPELIGDVAGTRQTVRSDRRQDDAVASDGARVTRSMPLPTGSRDRENSRRGSAADLVAAMRATAADEPRRCLLKRRALDRQHRRHPDLPWIKSAADLTISESLQSELLDAAAALTAPGGVLVYAVCSLEPEEGPEQIAAFLRGRTDFARDAIAQSEIVEAAFLTPEGDFRTLPSFWADRGGMDGFYAARLRKR